MRSSIIFAVNCVLLWLFFKDWRHSNTERNTELCSQSPRKHRARFEQGPACADTTPSSCGHSQPAYSARNKGKGTSSHSLKIGTYPNCILRNIFGGSSEITQSLKFERQYGRINGGIAAELLHDFEVFFKKMKLVLKCNLYFSRQ
jgi:hypothetical protein